MEFSVKTWQRIAEQYQTIGRNDVAAFITHHIEGKRGKVWLNISSERVKDYGHD